MLSPDQARRLASAVLNDADDPAPPAGHPENRPLPDRIADCRIVRLIGSGGMGVVFLAQQDHPHRLVAIKLLKPGMTSRPAMRRFHDEAEILARLQHPGIAQVFQTGMHDDGAGGVPYFVMEFIPGARTIIAFAEQRALPLRDRLELFTQVCDAVHHGHQKGIIHRDLKPDNILVPSPCTPGEGQGEGDGFSKPGQSEAPARVDLPQPKIIDFGIARATDSDLAVTTLQTSVGELLGTLQYMSPEQCEDEPRRVAAVLLGSWAVGNREEDKEHLLGASGWRNEIHLFVEAFDPPPCPLPAWEGGRIRHHPRPLSEYRERATAKGLTSDL